MTFQLLSLFFFLTSIKYIAFMYTRGFINLEAILRIPSPIGEECEYIFTLWSDEKFPKPICCRMTSACYKDANVKTYNRSYYYEIYIQASILEYGHNRPTTDDDNISNTLLLVETIISIKPTLLKHDSQSSYENTNPPVVHKIYEKKGPYIIRLTVEMSSNLKSPSERRFRVPSRSIPYSPHRESEPLGDPRDSRLKPRLTPRSTSKPEPSSVGGPSSMTDPLNTMPLFDSVSQNVSPDGSVQEKGNEDQGILTGTEEYPTASAKTAFIQKITDIFEDNFLSKERSDYFSRKRRHLG
ncbi:hypothetical protein J3Q64DRAFT_1697102 [Phycomyces blakesleeanus]